MKIIKNIRKTSLVLTLGCLLNILPAQAQITFADDVDDEAPAAPIDGMISLALVAGAYMGLRKKYKTE